MPYKNKTKDREWHRLKMRNKRRGSSKAKELYLDVTPVTPTVTPRSAFQFPGRA